MLGVCCLCSCILASLLGFSELSPSGPWTPEHPAGVSNTNRQRGLSTLASADGKQLEVSGAETRTDTPIQHLSFPES